MDGVVDVLVVDDNPGDRRFIEESLENSLLEVTVRSVPSEDEALDVVSHRRESGEAAGPDVILLDWNVSNEGGDELVDAAKSGNSPVLVVVMTGANPELSDMESAVPQADMYVQKPTETEGYVEMLRSVISDQ